MKRTIRLLVRGSQRRFGGRFINAFLPLVLGLFSLLGKGHLSKGTAMKFKNECPLTTWSLHGWNPICFSPWEISTLSPA